MPAKTFLFIGGDDVHSGVSDAAASDIPSERYGSQKRGNWVQRFSDWGWQRDMWTVQRMGLEATNTKLWLRILDSNRDDILNKVVYCDYLVVQMDISAEGLMNVVEEHGKWFRWISPRKVL